MPASQPHRPPARKEEWDFFEHIWQTAAHELLVFCAPLVIARIASKNTPQEAASFLTDVTMTQTLSEELRIFQMPPCAGYYSQVVTIAAASALKGLG
jgi:hypothetical protein